MGSKSSKLVERERPSMIFPVEIWERIKFFRSQKFFIKFWLQPDYLFGPLCGETCFLDFPSDCRWYFRWIAEFQNPVTREKLFMNHPPDPRTLRYVITIKQPNEDKEYTYEHARFFEWSSTVSFELIGLQLSRSLYAHGFGISPPMKKIFETTSHVFFKCCSMDSAESFVLTTTAWNRNDIVAIVRIRDTTK